MTTWQIRELQATDWGELWPLLSDLRPHLSALDALDLWQQANYENGYRVWGGFADGLLVAWLGARVLVDFVHGRHFYIDDLAVADRECSKGYGAKMLQWSQEYAGQRGCSSLGLCTGVDNTDGIRFYEREGWLLRAHAFKLKLTE